MTGKSIISNMVQSMPILPSIFNRENDTSSIEIPPPEDSFVSTRKAEKAATKTEESGHSTIQRDNVAKQSPQPANKQVIKKQSKTFRSSKTLRKQAQEDLKVPPEALKLGERFSDIVKKRIMSHPATAMTVLGKNRSALETMMKTRLPLAGKTFASRDCWTLKPDARIFDLGHLVTPDNVLNGFFACESDHAALFASSLVVKQALHMTDEQKRCALLLSHTGVGPGKLYQIMASDPSLSPQTREIFSQIRSNCAPTYSLDEAQKMVTELYGDGSYRLKKRLGVATISEVFLAENQSTNKPVIIKVLKKGVTQQALEAEHQLAKAFLKQAYPEPAQQIYKTHVLDNFYTELQRELDFKDEARNANALTDKATRYSVAQVLEQEKLMAAENPRVMVQEMAKGVLLDDLLNMLRVYKEDADRYQQEFSHRFEQHPWLKKPEDWMAQLPHAYRDSLNEQTLLRINANQAVASHPDPHTGNVFFDYSGGKLKPEYIDCGAAVYRDAGNVVEHGRLALNCLIGNSTGIADYVVENAKVLPENSSKKGLKASIAKALDEKLYKVRVNVTNGQYNAALIEQLLEEHGILLPENETAFMKSQMQAQMVYNEISKVVDQPKNSWVRDSAKDIKQVLPELFKETPLKTLKVAAEVAGHWVFNRKTCTRIMSQYL